MGIAGYDNLGAWCGVRLAKYTELTGCVIFVGAVPMDASGKILKRVLRERAKDEIRGVQVKL